MGRKKLPDKYCKCHKKIQRRSLMCKSCNTKNQMKLRSPDTNKKISETLIRRYKLGEIKPQRNPRYGKDNHFWKGGINKFKERIRRLLKYRKWREAVFKRDNYTCQECHMKGGYLNAHHLETFSSILDKFNIKDSKQAIGCKYLWDIKNGITLCEDCHYLVYH